MNLICRIFGHKWGEPRRYGEVKVEGRRLWRRFCNRCGKVEFRHYNARAWRTWYEITLLKPLKQTKEFPNV